MFKLSRKAKALLSGGSSKEDNKGTKGGSTKSVDSFSFGTNHHLLLTAEEREALREELKRLNDNLGRVNQDDNNDKVYFVSTLRNANFTFTPSVDRTTGKFTMST